MSVSHPLRKLPDLQVLLELKTQGWKDKDIAVLYGTTEHAVYRKRYREGIRKGRTRWAKNIPWRVRQNHVNLAAMRYLRHLERRRNKMTLAAAADRRLNEWLDWLKEKDLVIGYDENLPADTADAKHGSYGGRGGWFTAKRDDEDEPWPSVITTRDIKGRHRSLEELHPDAAGESE